MRFGNTSTQIPKNGGKIPFIVNKQAAEKPAVCLLLLLDFSVLFLVLFQTVADQNKDLAVYAPPLIVRNDMELVQYFAVNPYRQALNSHNVTSQRTYYAAIIKTNYGECGNLDTKCIQNMSKRGNNMRDNVDYKELYLKMVRANEAAIRILIAAQQECEELYLAMSEEENHTKIIVLPQNPPK